MALNWSSFEKLPGDSRINFENLCRGITRAHWAQYGQFLALKNQPGVEFHLNLLKNSPLLGDASRWYGWQCKKFDLTQSGNLTASSKGQITDSLNKTVRYLPDLTDWVLWTPYTLSKSDQTWFKALESNYPYDLHMWADEEIENNLSGPALMLRDTYFGELVVTPEDLKDRHDCAISSIKARWINPVHQETDVERIIRRMLGESEYWQDMVELGERISKAISFIDSWTFSDVSFIDLQKKFVSLCSTFSEMLLQFHKILLDGDIDTIQQWVSNCNLSIDSDIFSFPRLLRKRNIPISLEVINALDDIRLGKNLFHEVEGYLNVGMVAVLADAGGGKTHMAAELSSAQPNRPAGILLHGRNLQKGQNQNDLAHQFLVNGTPLDSMDKMLATLDAAAKRAKCILPLVIDGLNEAENPKDWKDILFYIQTIIKNYPNVLVICTLRTGEHKRSNWSRRDTETRETFAVQALPDDILKFECEGFGEDLLNAIRKYFKYYNIDCESGVEIPSGFLNHPLNLRIFCDVTNPKRVNTVKINYFPASLALLFDEYIKDTCQRISMMKNLNYSTQEVANAIFQLGIALWDANSREIDEKHYKELINDKLRSWNESIINLFAQEGLIFRNPGVEHGKYVITPVYDALGGHIIADALLKRYSHDRTFNWFNDQIVHSAFSGEHSHPLSYDIFKSLVALVPSRMYSEQLWKHISEPFRQRAIIHASELNPDHLDKETVNEIALLIHNKNRDVKKIFSRLWLTKGAPNHPLNADFLDSILWDMSVDQRDLSWTEWVRNEHWEEKNRIILELSALQEKWEKDTTFRSDTDHLRVKAIKWLLTSTNQLLRNAATKGLYWFGRGDAEFLFNETIKSLSINDPYVSERMLAASYGVCMSLSVQLPSNSIFTGSVLLRFAGNVFDAIFSKSAPHYTTHILIRDFASKIIELAQYHNNNFFSESDINLTTSPFSEFRGKEWGEIYLDDEEKKPKFHQKFFQSKFSKRIYHRINDLLPQKMKEKSTAKWISQRNKTPFMMDFENYTIGRLVPSRGNYDYDNKEFRKVRAQLQWRVEQLGWSYEKYSTIDKSIQDLQGYHGRVNDKLKIDRYGKKYSWIAYYEMYGQLTDKGIIEDEIEDWRSDNTNIDPSFSISLPSEKIINEEFLGNDSVSTSIWIKDGDHPKVEPYMLLESISSKDGPWIALDGYFSQENRDLKRRIFFYIRSFLVKNQDKDDILKFLSSQDISGRWLPEKSVFSKTYIAEVPWSNTFPDNGFDKLSFVIGQNTVTRQRPKVEIRNDDSGFSIIQYDEMEEYQEIEKIYKSFDVIIPISDLSPNVTDSEVDQIPILCKKMTREMELIGQSQSFDLFTSSGQQVTHISSYKGKGYNDKQFLYYVNKDLLEDYIKKNDMSIIWGIWGERSFSYSWFDNKEHDSDEPRYIAFGYTKTIDSWNKKS